MKQLYGRKGAEPELNIVLLEVGNLGSDMKFDRFYELGNVTIYEQTPPELVAERIGCGCDQQSADE